MTATNTPKCTRLYVTWAYGAGAGLPGVPVRCEVDLKNPKTRAGLTQYLITPCRRNTREPKWITRAQLLDLVKGTVWEKRLFSLTPALVG